MKRWAWSMHPDNAGDKAVSLGLIRSHLHCLFHCQSPDVTGISENKGRFFFFPHSDCLFLRAWPAEINSNICHGTQGRARSGAQHCCYSLRLVGFGRGCCCVGVKRPSWDGRSYVIPQVWNINCSRTDALEQNYFLRGLLYHELSPHFPA